MTAPPITAQGLKPAVLAAIANGAQPVAGALNVDNLVALDEGGLGDFPWYWQISPTLTNAKTFNWLNNLIAYDATNQFVSTNGTAFLTAYFNVITDTHYVLSAADENAYNQANLANAAIVSTLLTDWTTTQGPFPASATTQGQQLAYLMSTVLTWGQAGLTLAQLRTSTDPASLLTGIPIGADLLVDDLMEYLGATSSIATIQAAVSSANNQLQDTRMNVTPPPAAVGPGWMTIQDDKGTTQIVPEWLLAESPAVIRNGLLPAQGTGNSFQSEISASKTASNQVHVAASGGIAGAGDILDLIGIFGQASASLNLWSFDGSVSEVDITLTFNGVTAVTPLPAEYDASTRKGWWNPGPIKGAANATPNQSGYSFTPDPGYDFGNQGSFGTPKRLLISQQPQVDLKFYTSNYSAFSKVITQNSRWGVSFLGIPLAGGSQSYYQATTSQAADGQSVTVSMKPAGMSSPVAATDQLAYVVGAEMDWPGA
jgi:hypothetical protein